MMNTNKTLLSITVFTSLSLSTLTYAQSLSEEVFKNVDGKRFWQVQVNCDSAGPNQQLNKDVTSEQWCINGSTECFSDKQQAAEKACNKDISNSASVEEKAPEITPPAQNAVPILEEDDDDDYEGDEQVIDYDALRKEKIELEATRLTIQQELLELKRQEIELQKSNIVN